jgi:hypothetical protein
MVRVPTPHVPSHRTCFCLHHDMPFPLGVPTPTRHSYQHFFCYNVAIVAIELHCSLFRNSMYSTVFPSVTRTMLFQQQEGTTKGLPGGSENNSISITLQLLVTMWAAKNALIHQLFVRQVRHSACALATTAAAGRLSPTTFCVHLACPVQDFNECSKLVEEVLKESNGQSEYALQAKALISRQKGAKINSCYQRCAGCRQAV